MFINCTCKTPVWQVPVPSCWHVLNVIIKHPKERRPYEPVSLSLSSRGRFVLSIQERIMFDETNSGNRWGMEKNYAKEQISCRLITAVTKYLRNMHFLWMVLIGLQRGGCLCLSTIIRCRFPFLGLHGLQFMNI